MKSPSMRSSSLKSSINKPRKLLAASAALFTSAAAIAVLASGCASHSGARSAQGARYDRSAQGARYDKGGQPPSYQASSMGKDTSSLMKISDSSHSSSGYGGSGTGMGGAGFDPSIAGDSAGSYYDTTRNPYHYPGTAIPGTPGQGGSGGIPGADTTHSVTPPKDPDSAGSQEFIERG